LPFISNGFEAVVFGGRDTQLRIKVDPYLDVNLSPEDTQAFMAYLSR